MDGERRRTGAPGGGPVSPAAVADGLAGRAVLVSGSAAGIGRAVSEAFAAAGSRACLADVDGPGLEALAAELAGAPGEVATVTADVTTPEGAAKAVEAAVSAWGRLDVLVNVVGGSMPGKDVTELDLDGWSDVLRFNLTSMYLMCHHGIPHLRAAGGGSIVNISSGAGLRGVRKNPAYCAATAGVLGFTRALAADHGDEGIRVNAVAPGPIMTPLMVRNRTPEEIGKLGELTMVGRVGRPTEIAAAVLFLAGDAASFMTGQTLEVDGGVRGRI